MIARIVVLAAVSLVLTSAGEQHGGAIVIDGGHGGGIVDGGHGGGAILAGGHGGAILQGGHGGAIVDGGHGGAIVDGGHGGGAILAGGHGGAILEGGHGGVIVNGGHGGGIVEGGHGQIIHGGGAPIVEKHVEPVYPPQPYKFGYQTVDEYGSKQYRQETSDGHSRHGSYGFTDGHGIYREVRYVADAHGFRASVHTNEPGTARSNPANVEFHAQPNHQLHAAPAAVHNGGHY